MMRSTEFSALMRRIRVIPFPFQFLENPVAEHHRPVNRSFQELVLCDRWRSEFIRILIEVYARDVKTTDRFVQPVAVQNAGQEFFNESNPLASWLFEKYDVKAEESERITATQLATAFNSENPQSKLTPKTVGNLMSALGFHTKKSNGKDAYRGIVKKFEEGEGAAADPGV